MNIKLFTDDDTRENVFKHVEVNQPLNIGALQSGSCVAIRRVATPPVSSSGVYLHNKHLFLAGDTLEEPLMPHETPYAHDTVEGCYAEQLVDELNNPGGN